jgi:DNA-binding GntR family transcriptional regulator
VRDARRKFRLGSSPKELAEEYGVSSGAMRRALNGVTWKHLNDPEAVDAA